MYCPSFRKGWVIFATSPKLFRSWHAKQQSEATNSAIQPAAIQPAIQQPASSQPAGSCIESCQQQCARGDTVWCDCQDPVFLRFFSFKLRHVIMCSYVRVMCIEHRCLWQRHRLSWSWSYVRCVCWELNLGILESIVVWSLNHLSRSFWIVKTSRKAGFFPIVKSHLTRD